MNYILGLTITGIVSGLLAGVVGAGSEILIVPLLTIFGVYSSLKTSIGTSLIMLLPPIGIFAVIKFMNKGYGDIYGGLYMAILFTIFSYLTAKYSIYMNTELIKKFFAIFTIFSGIYILFSEEKIFS